MFSASLPSSSSYPLVEIFDEARDSWQEIEESSSGTPVHPVVPLWEKIMEGNRSEKREGDSK